MTIWFDVEDLVHYFQVGNKRISGIQRLSFEIFRGAKTLGDTDIRFVRHGTRPQSLWLVDWADLAADFDADDDRPTRQKRETVAPREDDLQPLIDGPVPARSLPRRLAKRAADILPPEIRQPLVLATVMQLQVAAAIATFAGKAAALPFRRAGNGIVTIAVDMRLRGRSGSGTATSSTDTFDSLAEPGDTLLVLGAPWTSERYSDLARWVRDEKRMRFGVLVHDLVPVRHPEWCHRGTPRAFREWYLDVLPFCDVVFANSRHTAVDVEAFAQENGIVLNGPVTPLPIGTGFGKPATDTPTRSERLPAPSSYVLFVSTLEARKNHLLAVRLWSVLLDEVAQGTRAPENVPDLVFAGRIGWLVSDLIGQLANTKWLGGRIRFVPDPSDTELRALYAGCLFTFFPSWHEGWGLPVTESLSMGKPCLSSNAASLPEAGGPLCRYFDPGSLRSAHQALTKILDDPEALAAWEQEVRQDFHSVPWTQTAYALLRTLEAL